MEYTTETGFYVLVDESGTIIAKANVRTGTHPVADDIDIGKSFDVESRADLSNYAVGETV